MRLTPRHVTLAIVMAGVTLAASVIGLKWREDRALANTALQLTRFPAEDAAVVSMDFGALRRGGLLNAAVGEPEPEYKQFVDGTGFDYRRHLDGITASLSNSGNYFLVRGRFDWQKLHEYVLRQGGSCFGELCRMQGSKPERRISFLPLREDYMALAVSTDDLAATRLTKTDSAGVKLRVSVPVEPVWISVPGAALRQQGLIPPGMHVMLSALTSADRVMITFGTDGGKIEARMAAVCRTKEDAEVLTSQLRNTALLIREGIAKKTVQQDDELARTLAAGTFNQDGSRVQGRWPVARGLIDSLAAGI